MLHPLHWIDAFADGAFAGNPAAVCWLDAPVDDAWQQSLATELGISETCFVTPGTDAFGLRWFTPSTEVDLCGHATLAAAHALRSDGRVPEDGTVTFSTRSGLLQVRPVGDLLELDLPSDPPTPVDLPDPLASWRPDVVACARSRNFVVVELSDAVAVASLVPDRAAVAAADEHAVVCTARAAEPSLDVVLRVFAPNLGIDEDPVTGSAQCAVGPYWASRLGRDTLVSAQLSARGGRLQTEVRGDRVGVAGRAVTVLRGEVQGP
jgi:predicted PhzF superfamily epimerase YddE/YHI9